ncbi:MAG TPA: MliC family protein [Candidatus Desulfobacillus sp.]|nr:MliC family protein [Candidatus Desulfobacillus sp.]
MDERTGAAILLAALAFAALAGCGEQKSAVTQEAAPAQAPVARESTARQYAYRCESGRAITARYPDTETAVIEHAGKTSTLRIAISASGARYVGDGLVWWTKGSGPGAEGTLYRHEANDSAGEVLESCAEAEEGGAR